MTAPKRPALDEAVDLITSVRNVSGPYKTSPRQELEALLERPELLRRMADEKAIR